MTESRPDADSAAAVLAAARSSRTAADAEEARLVQLAVEWAAMHSVDSIADSATTFDAAYGETGIPVAGPGAPLVAEFCVAEFALAVGLSTDAGGSFVGEAVELRHRLPRVWRRLVCGDLVAWKARRIARATLSLSPEAAGFVDQKVAPFAHTIRLSQLDRTIQTAIDRFMPDEAEDRRRTAADSRCFNIGQQQPGLAGTVDVWGTLDAADAMDLDLAVAASAQALADLGSTESLDVRRSQALAGLARHQLSLDLETGDDASTPAASPRPPKQLVLHVHLADAAIGRRENGRMPISVEQVRDWCANPDAQVVVKPVIDLNDHHHVDSYEVPARIAEQAALINVSCVFPWCTRSARSCDNDHIKPYAQGGTTSSDNIVPLCRRHHRLKTHGRWRYLRLEAGNYLWTSPHGYQFLRNETGTADVTRDKRPPPPPPGDQPPERQP